MTMLTILRGYSGSGKSTLARTLGGVIVSRDTLRAMITGSDTKTVLDNAGENLVTKMQTQIVRDALRAGKSVVIDDTNLRLKFARQWADLAVQEGVEWRVMDVTTPLEECVIRNSLRRDAVSTQVIETQAQKFRMPWPEIVPSAGHTFKPYVPDTSLPTAYGFDLDGTLAHNLSGRSWYDPSRYHEDTVNATLLNVLDALAFDGHWIILFSGRSEDHRLQVQNWLRVNNVNYDELVMRASGDNRDDAIVKSELFDEFIAPHYNFLAQFDDRDRVVHALRSKGITVYQVAPGAF